MSDMKLVSGSILLLVAEQAFAHTQLTPFPNHDVAAQVLLPVSAVCAILGFLLCFWGLLTETGRVPRQELK